jgi:hypothetical protein
MQAANDAHTIANAIAHAIALRVAHTISHTISHAAANAHPAGRCALWLRCAGGSLVSAAVVQAA